MQYIHTHMLTHTHKHTHSLTLILMLCLCRLYRLPQALGLHAEAHRQRALMDGWMDGGMGGWMDGRHYITCRLTTEVETEA